jgi:hypothetical protein
VDWLYENPLPELIVCGVLAAAFGLLAAQKQRGVFLIGVLVSLLLGGGVYFLDRGTQTDGELVAAAVDDIVNDFAQNDLEGTMAHISPRAVGLRARAAFALELIDVENVRITDVSVELTNENSIARAHFRVNADASAGGRGMIGHRATRWMSEWQKTDEGWLMTEIEPLDVLSGQVADWPEPFNNLD